MKDELNLNAEILECGFKWKVFDLDIYDCCKLALFQISKTESEFLTEDALTQLLEI